MTVKKLKEQTKTAAKAEKDRRTRAKKEHDKVSDRVILMPMTGVTKPADLC